MSSRNKVNEINVSRSFSKYQGPDIDPSEILGAGFFRNESSAVRDVNSTEDLNKAWFTTAKDKEALIDKGIAWKQGAWSQEVGFIWFNFLSTTGLNNSVETIILQGWCRVVCRLQF